MEQKCGKCWKSRSFEEELQVFISYLSKMKTVRIIYNFAYFSTFYTLFLQFFVQEIFKFKYDKFFVRHSASISKLKWFEQPWYFHKLQFISHKLFPSSSPHEQLCELVFFFLALMLSLFWTVTLDYSKNQQSELFYFLV